MRTQAIARMSADFENQDRESALTQLRSELLCAEDEWR